MNISEIVGLLAGLMWMGVIGIVVVIGVRASRAQPARGLSTLLVGVFVGALVLSVVASGLVFIQPEERGVVISAVQQKGYRAEALQPGLQWVIPFAENVSLYSISRKTYTMSSVSNEGGVIGDDSIQARTADGQIVYIDASVVYAIDPTKVVEMHINWQSRYEDGVIRPQSRGAIRDAVSQFGVEEIVSTKRGEMETMITTALEEGLAKNNLILVDFLLRNIRFSDEYAAAVEQKQIAEQLAQQSSLIVDQRKQEAEQARQIAQGTADAVVIAAQGAANARLIEAEAEAKALLLIAEVLANNPSLLTYQYINQLAPNINVMLLPSDAPFVFPLPDINGGQ